ncbi:uncharacterized protein LOC117642811 isoform X2 [Thrips palmi]|nr:uncharacterized protein LOC117642811 isoform X2 [Thrips palmi]XP_034237269.1 uncharacterized protein LOC117642811 isoform X2 [Thrips palmi]XP_034237270.1 uncharacterized protein LOC117642811 isoform X2 [Thrips palmi]XP_034237271.1 uncharacterized protein LOC117642811 isoform X2 [Thrips palmi]
MDCNICMEPFNDSKRRPKCIVPCGHTVCLGCLQSMHTRRCPDCRQEFSGQVEELPDNFFLLGLIESKASSNSDQRFWCRDCVQAATEDCVDQSHSLCSFRKMRAEQALLAAPKLDQLQKAALSARRVVQVLDAGRKTVAALLEAQLEYWQRQLRAVEQKEKDLRAAAHEGRDVEAFRLGGLQQLHDAAGLLDAKHALRVLDKDDVEWTTGAPQHSKPKHFQLLNPMVLGLLQFNHIAKVEKLAGVHSDTQPSWSRALLQRSAPRVEWLSVRGAAAEDLHLVRAMPALRFLAVHLRECTADVPELPLLLEELDVAVVPHKYLQALQRMPNLRKLALRWSPAPLHVVFPPLPPEHRGLQWLWVGLPSLPAVVSLARAHAATLQELRVTCASEGRSPWHFEDLARALRCCGLVALRRVILLRGRAPGFPDNKLPHKEDSCGSQKQAVWAGLMATAASDQEVKVVRVLCDMCDECPNYPGLGDFSWV